LFQARLHRHIRGRCSLESRTLRHQRGLFESPTYFSLFYEGSREAIVNRITFVSSTSKTNWNSSSKVVQILFHFRFLSTQSVEFRAVVGVTECQLTTGVGLLTELPAPTTRVTESFSCGQIRLAAQLACGTDRCLRHLSLCAHSILRDHPQPDFGAFVGCVVNSFLSHTGFRFSRARLETV